MAGLPGNDTIKLLAIANHLEKDYPFILAAVQAHIDRLPGADGMGRPQRSLLAISEQLQTKAFGPIFQAFCKKEAIYGYGDVQVKKMWEVLGFNN